VKDVEEKRRRWRRWGRWGRWRREVVQNFGCPKKSVVQDSKLDGWKSRRNKTCVA
jgi:hypothetical protein